MNRNSTNMFYLGIVLCLVCAVAAGIMGSAAAFTKEPIAQAKRKKVADGLRDVLPAFDNDPMKDSRQVGDVRFYQAKKDGKTVFAKGSGKMYLDGYTFYRSVNGVWLTKHVPKQYLTVLDTRR